MAEKIVYVGNPVLCRIASPVLKEEIGSKKIAGIINRMVATLRSTPDGIGIAAPQIGESLRIFLASEEVLAINNIKEEKRGNKKDWKYFIFINPEIVKLSSKKIDATEGCLSVPQKYGIVSRSQKVRVRAYDEQGKRFERGATNLFARLIQHEMDHLGDILYIDRAKKVFNAEKKSK